MSTTPAPRSIAGLTQRINELQLELDNVDEDRAHAEKMNGFLLVGLQDAKDQLLDLRGQIDQICGQIDRLVEAPA